MTADQVEVVKWFTRARKFPQLIGRTPDGARLWGGPYTVTQIIGAGVMLVLGTQTMGLWAQYGLLGNACLLAAVTYGLVLALGRIPVGSRNPLAVAAGMGRALTASTTGTLAGRPVRLARPHQVRHRIVVLQPAELPAASSTTGPSVSPAPPPAPVPTRRPVPAPSRQRTSRQAPAQPAGASPTGQPALSAVQSLLAQTAAAPADRRRVQPRATHSGRPHHQPVPSRPMKGR